MIMSKYKLLISMSILPFLTLNVMAVTKGEKKFIEEQIAPSIQLDVIAMRDKNLISKSDLEDLGNIKPAKQPDALVDLISDGIASGYIIKAPPPKAETVEAPVKKVITSKEPEQVVRRYILSDAPEEQEKVRTIIQQDPTSGIISELAKTARAFIRDHDDGDDRDSRRRDRWKDYDRRSDKTIIIKESKNDDDKGDKKKDLKSEKEMKVGDAKEVKKVEDLMKEKVEVKEDKKLADEGPVKLDPVKKPETPTNKVEELTKKVNETAPEKLDPATKPETPTNKVEELTKKVSETAPEKIVDTSKDTTADVTKKIVTDPLDKEKIDEVKDAAKDAVDKVADAAAKKPEVPLAPKNVKIGE